MRMTIKLAATLSVLLPWCLSGAVQNVAVQGTSPTQAVIAFTVPDPNDCLVQVSTDPAFGSYVDDTNDTLFPGSQKCNRAGSTVNGNDVVFVVGLRTSQKTTDGRFHSRALKCNTPHYYRIVSQFQPDPSSPRSFQTENLPQGATFPEPPPFDPTLTAFGNYAWPEFDWSDPTKSVIEPLTGLEVKPFTRPGTYANLESNLSWSAPYDAHGAWTNAANAATNGSSFASGAGGPTDYLFLPLPYFNSPTGTDVAGWNVGWGLDDILVRPYGSASVVDGTHNVIALCLSIDSGQTCASSTFNVTLTGTQGATALVPSATVKAIFANWALTARQGQKVPIFGTVNVSGSTVTMPSPWTGRYFDVTTAPGSKVFITGSSSMAPTPCVNNLCTVASVTSATTMVINESCSASGCPTGATFTGAGFGLRVAKTVSTGSVSVSFGYDRATSNMSDAGVNGAAEYCNRNTVTVTVDRTGAALAQNLAGYICTNAAGNSLYLLIPSNADGTARGEVRTLSVLATNGFTSNHLTIGPSGFNLSAGAFDPTDPNTFYISTQSGGKGYLLKGKYDTTTTDQNGRACDYREWPLGGPAAQYLAGQANTHLLDCVRWTNLQDATATPAQDIQAQIVGGYQTGLNSLGQTVTNHPQAGFDFSFMALGNNSTMDAGLASIAMSNGPNGLIVVGTFDLKTGILKHVADDWSQLPVRYGSCHGCFNFTTGAYRGGGMNNIVDRGDTHALASGWQATVSRVSRTNSGVTPVWDTNTALAYNEAYTCPTFTQDLIDLGGSGANCILVKVTSEPCAHTPSTFIFANGQTEVQKFPCTTNVGGTPTVPAGASGWSKLQDSIVGDWLQDTRIGFLGGTEKLIIATKTINAANDIDMWLIRFAGCNGAKFPPGVAFDTGGGSCYPTASNQTISTHNNGWSYWMAPPFSAGTDSGAASTILNPLSVTTPWIIDNYRKSLSHGAEGASPTNGNISSISTQGTNYLNSNYAVFFDLPFLSTVYVPFPAGTVTDYGTFAGKSGGPTLQNYGSLEQFVAPPKERVWALDYRHINPDAGNGVEADSGVHNGDINCTMTLQSGTSQTYQLATDVNGHDCLSNNPTPDRKRLPMVGVAGRYLLKDYSSAATGNVFGDAQTYGFCIANAANECRTGSAIGQQFVSVPAASPPAGGYCYSDQYTRSVPCVFTLAAPSAQIMQFDISAADMTGRHQRRLGYGLAGPLRQYQFNNARATPDGKYIIFPGNWVDGQRRELMIAELPPWPNPDAYDRTTFVPTPVSVAANPNAVSARVRFGYAENGPPASLFCTTRQESCSTDIPAQAPTDPYSFVSEAPTPTNCSNGCTINIPGISERVVYYVIDWLSTAGTVVQSSPLNAQVVAGTVLPSRRRPPSISPNVLLRGAVVR